MSDVCSQTSPDSKKTKRNGMECKHLNGKELFSSDTSIENAQFIFTTLGRNCQRKLASQPPLNNNICTKGMKYIAVRFIFVWNERAGISVERLLLGPRSIQHHQKRIEFEVRGIRKDFFTGKSLVSQRTASGLFWSASRMIWSQSGRTQSLPFYLPKSWPSSLTICDQTLSNAGRE